MQRSRSDLPVVPGQSGSRFESSHPALLTMGKKTSLCGYVPQKHPALLRGLWVKRKRRRQFQSCSLREMDHYSLATNFFFLFFFFSPREFITKILAE